MNIQTTHIKPYPNSLKPLAKDAQMQSQEPTIEGPKDEVTFSSNGRAMFTLLGAGVMMTGLMVGAQMGNPAVMLGAMFGGAAIMVAGAGG